jgi:hypothetical protein
LFIFAPPPPPCTTCRPLSCPENNARFVHQKMNRQSLAETADAVVCFCDNFLCEIAWWFWFLTLSPNPYSVFLICTLCTTCRPPMCCYCRSCSFAFATFFPRGISSHFPTHQMLCYQTKNVFLYLFAPARPPPLKLMLSGDSFVLSPIEAKFAFSAILFGACLLYR